MFKRYTIFIMLLVFGCVTTAYGLNLEVGKTSFFRLKEDSYAGNFDIHEIDGLYGITDSTYIDMGTGNAISIGTPGDIDFESTADGFNFNMDNDAGDDFVIDTANFKLVVEGDSGEVGIGLEDPASLLHIYAGESNTLAHDNTIVQIENDDHCYISMLIPNDGDKWAGVIVGDEDDNDSGGFVYNTTDDLLDFYAGGTKIVEVTATDLTINGEAKLDAYTSMGSDNASLATKYYVDNNSGSGDSWGDAVDSDILPTGNDNTYDLGSEAASFADVWWDGTGHGALTGNVTGNCSGSSGSCTGNAATVTNGVYTTDNLGALASTTSAQLAGVLSDETGAELVVFSSEPIFKNVAEAASSIYIIGNGSTKDAYVVLVDTDGNGWEFQNDDSEDELVLLNAASEVGTQRFTFTKDGNLIFGGATPDEHELTFVITDPTDTRTVTFDDNNVNFSDTTEDYVLTYNASTRTWAGEASSGGGSMNDLVDDLTPQLGGDLDLNGHGITYSGDVDIESTGAGVNINLHSDAGDDFAVDTSKFLVSGDTGYIGAGTADPEYAIHYKGGEFDDPLLMLETTKENGQCSMAFKNDAQTWVIKMKSSDQLAFYDATNSKTPLEITPSTQLAEFGGNVGIGVTPEELLHVKDTSANSDPAIQLENDAAKFKWTVYGSDSDQLKLQWWQGSYWSDIYEASNSDGTVTFQAFPVTPEAYPLTDYEVANKKYVDEYGGGGSMNDLVDDTTPQLGGNLDVNDKQIVSVSNGDIVIMPDGTGYLGVGIASPETKVHIDSGSLAIGGAPKSTDYNSIQLATDTGWGGTYDQHTGWLINSIMPGGWGSAKLDFYVSTNWDTYNTTPALSVSNNQIEVGEVALYNQTSAPTMFFNAHYDPVSARNEFITTDSAFGTWHDQTNDKYVIGYASGSAGALITPTNGFELDTSGNVTIPSSLSAGLTNYITSTLNDTVTAHVMLSKELRNTIISNYGSTTDNHYNFMAREAGWNVTFIKENDSYDMYLEPNGSENWWFRTNGLTYEQVGAGVSIKNITSGRSEIFVYSTTTGVYCSGDANWEIGS